MTAVSVVSAVLALRRSSNSEQCDAGALHCLCSAQQRAMAVRHGTVLATVLAGKFNDDTPLVLAITRYYWLLLAITVVAGNSG